MVPGIIGAILNGATQPVFGLLLSKALGALTTPFIFVNYIETQDPEENDDYIKNKIIETCIYMCACSITTWVGIYLRSHSFSTLGDSVTNKIRKLLYIKILEKNMGWFDDRDNSVGVLTNVMSSDTALLNGAGSESLGPMVEA